MSHLKLPQIKARLQQHRARLVGPDGERSWASVALVLRNPLKSAKGTELLFIRRSLKEGDPWSGHMAFPGGRQDLQDRNLSHTAMRETQEEVGLDLCQADFLGTLDDQVSPLKEGPAALVVRPLVFLCESVAPLELNHEVARSYWFPLEALADSSLRGTMPYTWQGVPIQLPVIRIGDADIWGLSLRMLDDFFEAIGWDSPC
jgi:ADP-ribose pyrophosphatase YjhB (NUDIX family)